MKSNPWLKLAILSLAGLVLSSGILWGINNFNRYNSYFSMNMNGYNMPAYGMSMQGGMYMNNVGNTPMNGINMQGVMNMPMNGMNMQQGGMDMMGGM